MMSSLWYGQHQVISLTDTLKFFHIVAELLCGVYAATRKARNIVLCKRTGVMAAVIYIYIYFHPHIGDEGNEL